MVPPTFDAEVVRLRALSPSVREVALARRDGEAFTFEPGQWVTLVLPSHDGEVRRAYSIASAPRGGPSFEIAVTRVESGVASRLLHAASVGDVVRAIGPQGFFVRGSAGDAPPPSLFIGTGTGIAPLRSMIDAALAHGDETPLWLLFGGREEHDILYRDELLALAHRHANLRIEVTLSRAPGAWAGRRGYVQAHAAELYRELARVTTTPPHVYICGLERMVGAVRSLMKQELGLPRQRVHSERYD